MAVLKKFKFGIIFLLVGLLIFFYPAFSSKFNLLPGDGMDCRFLNYVLEHIFLWIQQIEPHKSLWDMPVLYPNKNTLAYSDVLFGYEIIYAPLRLFFNEYLSYSLTVIAACILNFLSFYVFLKNILKLTDLASASGAFLFAFSLIRHEHLIHFQLLSQFYTILAAIFFFKAKDNKLLSYLGTFFVAVQFYTSFYLGYFIFFGIALAMLIGMFFKDIRNFIIKFLSNNYKILIENFILLFLLLVPLAYHYIKLGVTKFSLEILHWLVLPFQNYIFNESLLDNLLFFKNINLNLNETIGIGIFTSLISFYYIIKRTNIRIFVLTFILCIFIIVISVPILDFIYNYIPGAGAIRAVTRYILILLPIVSLIFAYGINFEKRTLLKYILIGLIILEAIPARTNFDWDQKSEEQKLAKYNVPASCNVIFLNYSKIPDIPTLEITLKIINLEIDASWLALKNKIYTVNGYNVVNRPRPYVKLRPECILELK